MDSQTRVYGNPTIMTLPQMPAATTNTATQVLDVMPTFEREYFIQTRKEIDTEKQERNKILNYAILAVGGISLALSRVGEPFVFLRSPAALCLYIPLLFLISVLIAARRAKLQQIADRWFVLETILRARGCAKDWISLETVVCQGLRGRRYLAEDLLLHLGLSMAPYLLIVWVGTALQLKFAVWLYFFVVEHAVIGSLLLCRPVMKPKHENRRCASPPPARGGSSGVTEEPPSVN